MVSILTYILLGLLIYIIIIPVIEELATVIVQGLEVIKSYMILSITKMQTKQEKEKMAVKKLSETKPSSTSAIGFISQQDLDYDEEENDDD